MKTYSITEENINTLVQAYERLGMVEVKGDSVEHLFSSRVLLKRSIESIKEIKEETPKEKGDA